jgi:hypothetical protein
MAKKKSPKHSVALHINFEDEEDENSNPEEEYSIPHGEKHITMDFFGSHSGSFFLE